jgi:hypothetical protein
MAKDIKYYNQQQTTIGYVAFGLLIFLITVGPFEVAIGSEFVSKLIILSFLILIPTSIAVAWKYAIPEKETFISRFFACLKDGFLVIVGCSLLFLTLVWLFNINNDYLIYFFVVLTLLLGVSGNKKIKRGEKTFERTWVDAIVITCAQMILAWAVLMLIAILLKKYSRR